MIVIDASVLVDLLLDREAATRETVAASEQQGTDEFQATDLLRLEVLQALRRHARRGDIADETAQDAVTSLDGVRLIRHPVEPLTDRIWALRHNLTAYDASYLALAETLDDPLLLTGDRGLADAAVHSLGPERVRYVA